MFTYELLREGEWTEDGRKITAGSTTWSKKAVPVVHGGDNANGGIVGTIVNIRREGNQIIGDSDFDIGEDWVITCDVDVRKMTEIIPTRIECTDVRIMIAHVSKKGSYPWQMNNGEEGGGEADGG
jgi:hypothetical protein